MTARDIEYFYSTHSAYAYLGAKRLIEICTEFDCRLVHRPFLLSPVVEAAGGQPFAGRTQGHVDYFFGREIERWAAFRGVPVISHRPVHHDNPLTLSSGVIIRAGHLGLDQDALAHAILRAHWVEDIDLMNADALIAAAASVDIHAAPLVEDALSEPVQKILRANTEEAIARGFFGSPTYVWQGDPFYGQDHLELLAFALQAPFPAPTFKNPTVG